MQIVTNGLREKIVNMAANIDLFKLWFPWNYYVVTTVGIELIHNLSNKPKDIGTGRPLTPLLNNLLDP